MWNQLSTYHFTVLQFSKAISKTNDIKLMHYSTLENERHANEIARLTAPKDAKISFTAYHRHAEVRNIK